MPRLHWTDLTSEEKAAYVRKKVAEEVSASEIAASIRGATRNAIIGCADRNGITLPGGLPREPRKKSAPKRAVQKKNLDWSTLSAEAKAAHLRTETGKGRNYQDILAGLSNATVKAIKRCAERNRIRLISAPRTAPAKKASRGARRVEKPAGEPLEPKAAALEGGPVNILDIGSGQCRAPQWQDKPKRPLRSPEDWMFCGAPVQPNSSYCAACHAKFWKPPNHEPKIPRKMQAAW